MLPPGAVVMEAMQSLLAAKQLPGVTFPVVTLGLIGVHPPDPAGKPPVVERYTRSVPTKRRLTFPGSAANGAENSTGSGHAGSVPPAPQGAARVLLNCEVRFP